MERYGIGHPAPNLHGTALQCTPHACGCCFCCPPPPSTRRDLCTALNRLARSLAHAHTRTHAHTHTRTHAHTHTHADYRAGVWPPLLSNGSVNAVVFAAYGSAMRMMGKHPDDEYVQYSTQCRPQQARTIACVCAKRRAYHAACRTDGAAHSAGQR